jgi:hypothetical protein
MLQKENIIIGLLFAVLLLQISQLFQREESALFKSSSVPRLQQLNAPPAGGDELGSFRIVLEENTLTALFPDKLDLLRKITKRFFYGLRDTINMKKAPGFEEGKGWVLYDHIRAAKPEEEITCDGHLKPFGIFEERDGGEDPKLLCWDSHVQKEEKEAGCVIISVGSNNQFSFEEAMVKDSTCHLHTFDCTVADPTPPASLNGRMTYYNFCLDERDWVNPETGYEYISYATMIGKVGSRPKLLKMDCEGCEWNTIPSMIEQAEENRAKGLASIFPIQIAIEWHYRQLDYTAVGWVNMGKSGLEVFSFAQYM